MDVTVTGLTFVESGGFTGLLRGCTLEPAALPDVPRFELQGLAQETTGASDGTFANGHLDNSSDMRDMRDMQVYTLELVMQAAPGRDAPGAAGPRHRVLRFAASDVPDNVSALIEFLRDRARPLKP
jgi:hypothetical protein